MVDLDELKKDFLNEEFDSKEFQLDADKVVTAALASGETRSCFVDTDDQTFRRHPPSCVAWHLAGTYPSTFQKLAGYPWTAGKR